MICDADKLVSEWAMEVVKNGKVVLGPPASGAGVRVHLLQINPQPITHGVKRSRLNLSLTYLVTASIEPIADAHRMLEDLLLAAMACPDFELERDPPPLALWQAFGVPPQPCFSIRVQTSAELPVLPVRVVQKAVFEAVPTMTLTGLVVGPAAIPIFGALVDLPSLNASCRTDHDGNFAFPMVPAGALGVLRVRAKGREQTVDLSAGPIQTPLTIELKMED